MCFIKNFEQMDFRAEGLTKESFTEVKLWQYCRKTVQKEAQGEQGSP